eukprot:s4054_g12.t1
MIIHFNIESVLNCNGMPISLVLPWEGSIASRSSTISDSSAVVVILSGCLLATILQVGSTRTSDIESRAFVLKIIWKCSFSCLHATIVLWLWAGGFNNWQNISSTCLAAVCFGIPFPCTFKERLLRASLALLCFVGMVAIRSSALLHQTNPLQSSTLAFLFLMLCTFFLQALNPVADKKADSSAQTLVQTGRLGRLEEPFTFPSFSVEPGAKFMKSTVASRMRSQAAQALKTGAASACGEGRFQPEKVESTKLKQDTPRPRNEVDAKDQRERPQGNDSQKNDKMCHKTERQGIHRSNTNCGVGRPRVSRRLLECFRAGGRLLRRVHPRIVSFWKLSNGILSQRGNQTLNTGVEVQDLPGVPSGVGDGARRDQESWHRDLQATNMTNTVKPLPVLNPKQKMAGTMRQPDKNTSCEKLPLKQHHSGISSHVPEQACQERGFPDNHTKFCIRPVFESKTLVPASFDKMEHGSLNSLNLNDEAAVQSFKSQEPKKPWRSSRRGHSPRQECMVQKENICPAGTARVDKETKKLQQLNYLRRLPCAKHQVLHAPNNALPVSSTTKHSTHGMAKHGDIFIDPEFQDSPTQAFLELVAMCERCETGHLQVMAALRSFQGSMPRHRFK